MRPTDVSASEVTALLRLVQGVAKADVVVGGDGEIRKIEIAVVPGRDSRRIVRDVESALYSGLGIIVDHRAIEIVSNGSGNGCEVSKLAQSLHLSSTGATVDGSTHLPSRIELAGVELDSDGELFCEVAVELKRGNNLHRGADRDADTPKARMMAVGRATVNALATSLERETALSLEGIQEFAICEHPGLIAAIGARRGRTARSYVGTALVEGSREETAARAVLDALNRFWLAESESIE